MSEHSFDVSPLLEVHPDDYPKVAEFHLDQFHEDDKKSFVAAFLDVVSSNFSDIDDSLPPESKAIAATYFCHLYLAAFHEMYDSTEDRLKTATKLNNLLSK